jgi:hypothetical protein
MKTTIATAGGQRDSAFTARSFRTAQRRPHTDRMTRSERLELVAAVLLATATIATAWAAYQARQWTGEQAREYSVGTASRIAENRAAAVANRDVQIDVATFIQWVDARERRDAALARFYRTRFRDEFKPAFASWLADPDAPETPFAMPQYRLAATGEADRLESTAAAASERAQAANERAGDYMLAVVLFASALFFAGISTRLESPAVRRAILGLGSVVLLATLVWLATFPVHLNA